MELVGTRRSGWSWPKVRAHTGTAGRRGFSRLFLPSMLAFSIVSWTCLGTYEVQGSSMQPTLEEGQRLLVLRGPALVSGVQDGDVVVIRDPESSAYIVKRIYRMGGETVEPILKPIDAAWNPSGYLVPQQTVFVLGDNLRQSEDSRLFGPVPISRVVGKVLMY